MTDAHGGEIAIMTRGRKRPDRGNGALAVMNSPIFMRAALAGALLAALTLSGCGRKGALEPPPGVAATQSPDGKPVPTKPDRHFVLDPLVK